MMFSSRPLLSLGTILLGTVMLSGGLVLVWKNTPKKPTGTVTFSPPVAPQAIDGNLTTARDYVCGVGVVEPAGEAVAVGAPLSGVVAAVHVKSGDKVSAGDLLIQLDDRVAKAEVEVARAHLLGEEARLQELLSQIEIRKARVDTAVAELQFSEASLAFAEQELERTRALQAKGAVSDEEAELKLLNRETERSRQARAQAALREMNAELKQIQGDESVPTVAVQQAAIVQSKSSLQRAEAMLSQYTIRAPGAFTVLQVHVHPGEFLPAATLSQPLLVLGVIDPLHIRVEIDETDIPRFSETAQAWASVRGNSQRLIALTFVKREPIVVPKLSLSGGQRERIDTRVQQVIYSVAPSDFGAAVGQQVDIYVEATADSAEKRDGARSVSGNSQPSKR